MLVSVCLYSLVAVASSSAEQFFSLKGCHEADMGQYKFGSHGVW